MDATISIERKIDERVSGTATHGNEQQVRMASSIAQAVKASVVAQRAGKKHADADAAFHAGNYADTGHGIGIVRLVQNGRALIARTVNDMPTSRWYDLNILTPFGDPLPRHSDRTHEAFSINAA